SPSNGHGFTPSTADYREKEDMYDEIIRLKKSLQAHKSDNQQLKVKLRRLEEDNTKREKQIEELLDPTKGSAYTRSFVDKRKEGSVVVNGLKQRILKLEQQCREKENALSKLQSELRTTNLEELKITVETYFQEIQRLKILLEAAEKNGEPMLPEAAEGAESAVHRLSEALKELQREIRAAQRGAQHGRSCRRPESRLLGYREWSKQRLLRRLLEVETVGQRLEDSRRHAHSAKRRSQVEQEVQAGPTEVQGVATATEAAVSVGTMTEDVEESSGLKELLSQLDDELRQLRTQKEDLEKETECWKAEQIQERDQEKQQHKEELEQLMAQIQTLEERMKPAASAEDSATAPAGAPLEERGEVDAAGTEEEGGGEGLPGEKSRSESASVIQRTWREHRERLCVWPVVKDLVMLQSALRGHLSRESQLQGLPRELQNKVPAAHSPAPAVEATNPNTAGGQRDAAALTLVQSAFRGHLARCTPETNRMGNASPVPRGARSAHPSARTDDEEEEPGLSSSANPSRTDSKTASPLPAAAVDSDDSDDIIVSPSRPLRSREV
uniref:IQ motif containing E n=1 Tax=Tetraodon nigroviridis TaxID=99883 RepID=H3CS54_TETNG